MDLIKRIEDVLYATSLSILGGILFVVEITVNACFDVNFFWGFSIDKDYRKDGHLSKYVNDYLMGRKRGDFIDERTRSR